MWIAIALCGGVFLGALATFIGVFVGVAISERGQDRAAGGFN